jgi:hypothetical protein
MFGIMPGLRRRSEFKQAAELIALCELSDTAIAERLNVALITLRRWRKNDSFTSLIKRYRERVNRSFARYAISRWEHRLARANREWERLQMVIEARANDPTMKDVPGGSTGLVVRKVKRVHTGDGFQLADYYEVDYATLHALLAYAKQAMREVAEWNAKHGSTRTNGY